MTSEPAAGDLYALRPDLYDLMHADYQGDVQFLREFVQLAGAAPEVLELGCGTGRLLLPLLEAGAAVTGLDREPAMLGVARRRLAPYGDRARLVTGEMRRFTLPQTFDLAVLGLNTFMHLLTAAAQIDCLQAIHAHLRPAGLLFVDLPNPHATLRELPTALLHQFTRPSPTAPGTLVTLWSATSFAVADQLVQSTLFFDESEGAGGPVRRTVGEVTLRLTFRYELELLLARAGFAVRSLYGDYDSTPYQDESERLICIAAALA